MENIIIESNQNKIIKEVNALKAKKERDKTGLFILEGKRLVEEIPNSWEIKYLLKAESYSEDINFESVYTVKDSLFEKISETVNPQGILAVCHIKEFDVTNVDYGNSPFFVVLENVTDPGNMGTLIRTADAAGADGIFLSKGCVDIYNPKVIRATMGSIFHLPIYRNLNLMDLMEDFKNNNVKIIDYDLSILGPSYLDIVSLLSENYFSQDQENYIIENYFSTEKEIEEFKKNYPIYRYYFDLLWSIWAKARKEKAPKEKKKIFEEIEKEKFNRTNKFANTEF